MPTPQEVRAKLMEIRARKASSQNSDLGSSQIAPSDTSSQKVDPAAVRAKLMEIRAAKSAQASPPPQPLTDPAPTAQPEQNKSWLDKAEELHKKFDPASAVGDMLTGQLKGIADTALSVASSGSNILEKGYNATIGKLTGKRAFQGSKFAEDSRNTPAIQPENTAQKIGFGTEKIGEFLIPSGSVSKGAKAAEAALDASKLPAFLRGAAKVVAGAGLEGAANAGVTAAQGGSAKDVAENAALGAGGVVAGKALGALGKAVENPLKVSAEKSYAQALGATTKENKAIAQTVVPQLIDKKVSAFSRAGLMKKAEKGVEVAGQAIDAELGKIPKNAPVNLANVADDLERTKQSFMVPGANGKMVVADPQAVQHIEGFQNIIKQIGEKDAPYESVRQLRQIWDKSIADAKGFYGKTVTEGSILDAKKAAANSLRSELAKEFPDLAKVNREYSFWSKTQKVLEDTLERTQSQRRPITETIRRTAGAVIGSSVGGGAGAVLGDIAMGGLSKLVDSTAWKTIGAIQKTQIANFLASGKLEEAIKIITKAAAAHNVKE